MPDGAHEFSSTQIALPKRLSQALVAWGKRNIPDADLGEEGRETDPHITLKYGLHEDKPNGVQQTLAGEPEISFKLGKTALFRGPDAHVLHAEVDSPDLHRLNRKVSDAHEHTDTHQDYKPHATIAYLKPGKGDHLEGKDALRGASGKAKSVTFSSKNGTKTDIPLGDSMPGKFMRQQAKKGRQAPPGADPLAAPLEPGASQGLPAGPTSPKATADLAAGGEKIARGQSPAQPMTPEGHATAVQVGQDLAKSGGPTKIVTSTSRRAQETASDVNAQQATPVPIQPSPGMESQNQGMAEGAPKGPELKKLLADMIRKGPGFRIPGQGALANRPGESFTEFRIRGLSEAKGLMQQLAQNPQEKIVVATSTHTIKLIEAWTDKETPDDMTVSPDTYLKEGSVKPGDMFRWGPSPPDGKLTFEPFDPAKQPIAPGAIYFLAHGETAASTNPNPTDMQKQRAQIVKHALTRNWQGLDTAAKAATKSGMSDEELSSAIDEALPSVRDAAGLSNPDLMAVHAAASPAKRQDLLPVTKQRFSPQALAGLPPEASNKLRSHLGRIGAL